MVMNDGIQRQGTIPVRPGEELNVEGLQLYLARQLSIPADQPLEVVQYSAGASNLTYLLTSGEWRGVLRRPPLGPLPPKAHDMQRESSFLQALNPVFSLAPKPYVFCEDPSILGSSFYVMEYREGFVFNETFPEGVDPSLTTREAISETFIDTLVRLHGVNVEQSGIARFGHPDGYLKRQVTGFLERYHRAQTDDVPDIAPLATWFLDNMPASPAPTVVHNDFKLNNILLNPENLTDVTAVVDWEMATIGDPLLDLAIALGYWIEPSDEPEFRRMMPTVTQFPGFASRRDLVERYAVKSGRDVSHLNYYLVFAYFKLSVILLQIYARWKKGQTKDPRFAGFGQRINLLVSHVQHLMTHGANL